MEQKQQVLVVDDDRAMKLGATDFVCKPFEDHELEVLLATTLRQRQLSQEVESLRAQLNEQSKYTMLFGHSDIKESGLDKAS